jgi:parallel beta-helix repeat protein
MMITNNHLHHNPIGVICSLDCSDILIEGNEVHDNSKAGIFLSRNMYDSVVRNNTVYDEVIGIIVSESPNNTIVDNKIHASESGISLINPVNPDDGETENNIIHNNTITGAELGIAAIRSQDNVLENNDFSDVEFEYYVTLDSSLIIQNQTFNGYEIKGSIGTNMVEIADSGIVSIGDEVQDSGSDSIRERLTHDTLTVDSQ